MKSIARLLAAAALVVVACTGDSGVKIVRQSIEGGLLTRVVGTDGLRDAALIADVGAEALATSFFSSPTSPKDNPAQETLHAVLNAEYGEGTDKPFGSAAGTRAETAI